MFFFIKKQSTMVLNRYFGDGRCHARSRCFVYQVFIACNSLEYSAHLSHQIQVMLGLLAAQDWSNY